MVRDFSENAKNTLYEQIDSVTPQNMMEGVADFFGDLDYQVRGWLGELCIENYVNNVDEYHKLILDENNTTKQQIDTVFSDVSEVEHIYAGRLQALQEQLVKNTSYFERLSRMIAPEKIVFLEHVSIKLRENIGDRTEFIINMLLLGYEVAVDEEMRALLEQKLADMTENRYGGKSDISQMSEKEMKKLICLYDFLYPDTAKKMDDILASGKNNTLTDADKNKMKYIAYTAPEPYRSVYLGYVDSYEVGSFGGKIIWSDVENNQYYKYTDRTYFVDTLTAFAGDPRGEYTTWFHESGHATDCNAQTGLWKFYCLNFSTYNETMGGEVTLQDAIYYDVYNNIEEKIRSVAGEEEEVIETVLESFKYGAEMENLTTDESKIRNTVIRMYSIGGIDDLSDVDSEAASDIYGGVTNLEIGKNSGYGHRPHREKDDTDETYQEKIDNYTYWYHKDGNATGAQSKELFAEYFSYYMTGDEEAIESMRAHLPVACDVLDEMLEAMAQELNSEE
ncbi:MAG: hypothetical protein MR012_10250 [Roseburia sp.]|nr:hypothetical protein [Roseburia sp.]